MPRSLKELEKQTPTEVLESLTEAWQKLMEQIPALGVVLLKLVSSHQNKESG